MLMKKMVVKNSQAGLKAMVRAGLHDSQWHRQASDWTAKDNIQHFKAADVWLLQGRAISQDIRNHSLQFFTFQPIAQALLPAHAASHSDALKSKWFSFQHCKKCHDPVDTNTNWDQQLQHHMSIRHAAHMTAVALGCNSMQTAGLWISKAHMLCSSGAITHQTGFHNISPHTCENVQQDQQHLCEQSQHKTGW